MSKKAIKAFPFADNDGMYQEGMDLRDYFAAKALETISWSFSDNGEYLIHGAERAYLIADAMMKAREQ